MVNIVKQIQFLKEDVIIEILEKIDLPDIQDQIKFSDFMQKIVDETDIPLKLWAGLINGPYYETENLRKLYRKLDYSNIVIVMTLNKIADMAVIEFKDNERILTSLSSTICKLSVEKEVFDIIKRNLNRVTNKRKAKVKTKKIKGDK